MSDFVMRPDDELTHKPDASVNFNESVYTNGFDTASPVGGWMRLGNRVNEGYAELSVCLYLPNGRIACQFQRPGIASNDRLNAGGLSYAVVEPLKKVSMTYDGEMLIVDDPEALRDPKTLFANGPRVPGHVHWVHEAESPVHGGKPVDNAVQTMYGRDFSLGNFNQHGRVRGEIKVGSETFPIDGRGWLRRRLLGLSLVSMWGVKKLARHMEKRLVKDGGAEHPVMRHLPAFLDHANHCAELRLRRIGVLVGLQENDPDGKARLSAFTHGLQELGWTEGHNVRMDIRWAADDVDRMRIFAKELVDLQPEIVLTYSTPVTAVLQRETLTIPIVFVNVSDPIGAGFVASLARPGGHLTGFINYEGSLAGKWLELLTEIAPGVKRVAMLFNPDLAPGGGSYFLHSFEAAARSIRWSMTPRWRRCGSGR